MAGAPAPPGATLTGSDESRLVHASPVTSTPASPLGYQETQNALAFLPRETSWFLDPGWEG
jgi:hypothetical protein